MLHQHYACFQNQHKSLNHRTYHYLVFFFLYTDSPGSVGLPDRSLSYSSGGERSPSGSAPGSLRGSQYLNHCDPYASPPGNSSYPPLNHSPTLPVSQQNMMPSIPFSDAGMPGGLMSPASQGLGEAMRAMVNSGPVPVMNSHSHSGPPLPPPNGGYVDDFTPGPQQSWIEQPQY